MNLKRELGRLIHHKFFFVGLLSFIWLLFRTGMKPTRITYPCQKTAAVTTSLWYATYILPIGALVRQRTSSPSSRNLLIGVSSLIVGGVICVVLLMNGAAGSLQAAQSGGGSIGIHIADSFSAEQDASDIFVVNGTTGADGGVPTLLDLMAQKGLQFYSLSGSGGQGGRAGLIGKDDVVIIKVNSQWPERGGTNTDVVKALIRAITNHPEGFTGEIIIADNGQGLGSFSRSNSNAETTTQSFDQVVAAFSGTFHVSTYLWDTISANRVNEYDTGDTKDGYVVNTMPNPRTGICVSYPKFTTKYGTQVSLKDGIWANNAYDSTRLKLINVPVVKTHSLWGLTGAVKHYMGVVSDQLSSKAMGKDTHSTVGSGGMGTEMVESRFPILTVMDAIWINANPCRGPVTSYGAATRVNVIAASTDPIALDSWAARSILIPAARAKGYPVSTLDPDNMTAMCPDAVTAGYSGSFGHWLELSMAEIRNAGYPATMDAGSMNVYVVEQGTPLPSMSPVEKESPTTGAPAGGKAIGFEATLGILAIIGTVMIYRRWMK